jgi:hypothetical protein
MAITKAQLVSINEEFIEILTTLDNEHDLPEALKKKFIGVFTDTAAYEIVGSDSLDEIEHRVAIHTCDEDEYSLKILIDTEAKVALDFELFIYARISLFAEKGESEKQAGLPSDQMNLPEIPTSAIQLQQDTPGPSYTSSEDTDIKGILSELSIPETAPDSESPA